MEDMVAHAIAIIQTSGFFLLAFAALLGFVDLGNAAAATFLGTVMGYAVGKMDPIMSRYYAARIHTAHPATGPPTPETASPASSTPATTGATGG
jgi:ABC-type transporter Mla maintaining outer membrane lipid asymmetry permease subunit MlaE